MTVKRARRGLAGLQCQGTQHHRVWGIAPGPAKRVRAVAGREDPLQGCWGICIPLQARIFLRNTACRARLHHSHRCLSFAHPFLQSRRASGDLFLPYANFKKTMPYGTKADAKSSDNSFGAIIALERFNHSGCERSRESHTPGIVGDYHQFNAARPSTAGSTGADAATGKSSETVWSRASQNPERNRCVQNLYYPPNGGRGNSLLFSSARSWVQYRKWGPDRKQLQNGSRLYTFRIEGQWKSRGNVYHTGALLRMDDFQRHPARQAGQRAGRYQRALDQRGMPNLKVLPLY